MEPQHPAETIVPQMLGDMFGGGAATPQAAGPPPIPNFNIPQRPEVPFPTFSGGGAATFTPENLPNAPTLTADPALASREEYMRGREGRVMDIINRSIANTREGDPMERPWWQRVGELFGTAAQSQDVAHMGGDIWGQIDGWRQEQRQIERDVAQLELGAEDVRGQTAESGFARQSGEHAVGQQNLQNQFNVDTANVGQRNNASQFNVGERNASSRAAQSAQLQLALARYQELQGRIDAATNLAAQQGGAGGFAAAGSMFQDLDPSIGQGVMTRQAETGLVRIIENSRAMAGNNENRQANAIHHAMEGLAGHTLPRPNRNVLKSGDPAMLARYYVQQGVPLDNAQVLSNYPGFSVAQ